MAHATKIVLLAVLAFSTSSAVLAQDRDRDRVRYPAADRDRVGDRDRVRDRDSGRIADRDRLQERDQDRVADRDGLPDGGAAGDRSRNQNLDRDRLRQPLHVQDREQLRTRDIYGSALMSREERRQYRERLQEMEAVGEWARYRAEHQARMVERAREQGFDLPPPMFGQPLMTDQERQTLGERMREAATEQERQRIAAEHREQMQARAREHQIPLNDLE